MRARAAILFWTLCAALLLVPSAAFADVVAAEIAPEASDSETWDEEASAVLGASYMRVPFAELYEQGKLSVSDGVDVRVVETSSYRGLLLSGAPEQMREVRLEISDPFEFTADKPVGRVSVDGLAGGGSSAAAYVYIDAGGTGAYEAEGGTGAAGEGEGDAGADDADDAGGALTEGTAQLLAEFPLDVAAGPAKAPWQAGGVKTQDVLGNAAVAAGEHEVTLVLEVAPEPAADVEAGGTEASVLVRSIEFSQSSLPVIYFNLEEDESAISDEQRGQGFGTAEEMMTSDEHSAKCTGSFELQIPDGYTYEYTGEEAAETASASYDLEYIRGRGNSTWNPQHNKKPYKIKLGKRQSLLGMKASKHWVLLANAFDDTLSKNRMTLWLGAQLGMAYTPQCAPVEVVINGVYQGSYLLCSQVRIDKASVNIDELELDAFYESSDEAVATVDDIGVVHAIAPGAATITATYYGKVDFSASYRVVVAEPAPDESIAPGAASAVRANPLKVKGKTVKASARKLKRGKVTVKPAKAFKVTRNLSKAKIAYKKTSGNAKIKVSSKGKITLKKGLRRGTYKLKVKVIQRAGAGYKAKTIKRVVVKVKVT